MANTITGNIYFLGAQKNGLVLCALARKYWYTQNHIGLAILLVALLSWHPVIEERCDGELLEESGDLQQPLLANVSRFGTAQLFHRCNS